MPIPAREIETDYLIVGAGAAGMAFADTLIDQSDADIVIVDQRGKPGGHWNDAYPFVTLHQPSAFYGVNSTELGSGRKDHIGLNAGLYELASGAEVAAYYDRVMNHRLLASGRVRHYPLCRHVGGGEFESLLSGARTRVTVRRRIVDATYGAPVIPSLHTPRFECAPGVRLVAPNALPGLGHGAPAGPAARRFVVIGAGKTAMDTCVWLLQSGADPDAIRWVVPRDSWLINRLTTQTGPEFFDESIGGQAAQMQACAEATSVDDLFLRLEACGAMLRIDADRTPTMFHFATISLAEREVLRKIVHVIRLGHVRALEPSRMVLDGGSVEVEPGTLFIDCSASAVEFRPTLPVFEPGRIVLQLLRLPQPAFSAALTAYVEAREDDDASKNRLCTAVAFPHTLAEYPGALLANMRNQYVWSQDKALRDWIRASRLDGFGRLMAGADKQDAAKQATLARYKEQAGAAMANLPRFAAAAHG